MSRSSFLLIFLGVATSAQALAGDNPSSLKLPPTAEPSAPTDVICLGMRSARVNLLLGNPIVGSTIGVLNRRFVTYADGTKIVFVNDGAVSAVPGGLAIGDLASGFTVEVGARKIFIEPSLLCGNPAPEPFTTAKVQVEENIFFAAKEFGPPVPPRAAPIEPCAGEQCKKIRQY